ncbi:MAG: transketolase [Selenomonadaceae bacterium]|nr:transketolase [Selenomonadaceae bacterium]
MTTEALCLRALNMRKTALKMAYESGISAHIGGGLSCIDILAVLYGEIMNVANRALTFAEKDKFIMSKGHGVLGLYAALAEFGVISKEILSTFQKDGSDLIAHPVMNEALGLESSSGSLGQGISMGVGLALLAKRKNYSYEVFVICGNGECNEGSVWEAVMSAVQFELDNFTVIIDDNGMQSDGASKNIMDTSGKYFKMFNALGLDTREIDGHNTNEILKELKKSVMVGKPRAIIAHTVKGKGISFMEGNNEWHHNRLTEKQYLAALGELEKREATGEWK